MVGRIIFPQIYLEPNPQNLNTLGDSTNRTQVANGIKAADGVKIATQLTLKQAEYHELFRQTQCNPKSPYEWKGEAEE